MAEDYDVIGAQSDLVEVMRHRDGTCPATLRLVLGLDRCDWTCVCPRMCAVPYGVMTILIGSPRRSRMT
jgi:hypothetical protein